MGIQDFPEDPTSPEIATEALSQISIDSTLPQDIGKTDLASLYATSVLEVNTARLVVLILEEFLEGNIPLHVAAAIVAAAHGDDEDNTSSDPTKTYTAEVLACALKPQKMLLAKWRQTMLQTRIQLMAQEKRK